MIRKQLIRLFAATLAVAVLAFTVYGTRLAQAAPAAFIEVGDNGDPGTCGTGTWTLRCAINYANGHPSTSIRFAFGLQAIHLQSALPTITGNGTWIDGHDFQDRCCFAIIDGSSMSSGNGLTINAINVTISNITVVNIPFDGEDISIVGGFDTAIAYDYLGILPGATQCAGLQSAVGVIVTNDRAGIVGNDQGTAYIYANTISCHIFSGVDVVNSSWVYVGEDRTGNFLSNNVGTTADGVGAAGNGDAGVRVALNSDYVTIRKNQILYNANAGVTVDGTSVFVLSNTLSANYWGMNIITGSGHIEGNKIGTSADGLLPLPNTHEGILIAGGTCNYLRDNLVAFNGAAGIAVIGSDTHASIEGNNIYQNGGLPIDLGNDGPTPNGAHSPPGPNNWQPYPEVSAFSGSVVTGTTCITCTVYVFKALGNPAAPGGGGIYQAEAPLPNGSGQWSVDLSPYGLTRLDVTFTAKSRGCNTSEMSPRPQLLLPVIVR